MNGIAYLVARSGEAGTSALPEFPGYRNATYPIKDIMGYSADLGTGREPTRNVPT